MRLLINSAEFVSSSALAHLDRGGLEASSLTVLLQHVSGLDLSTLVDLPTVNIPKVDHVNLVSSETSLRFFSVWQELTDAIGIVTYGEGVQYVTASMSCDRQLQRCLDIGRWIDNA